MNIKKRNLELISGILSVVTGVFIIIASIIMMIYLKNFDAFAFEQVLLTLEIIAAFTAAVMGALICTIPYKGGTFWQRRAFLITALVLFSVFSFFYWISVMAAFTVLGLIVMFVCIAVIVLNSIALKLKRFITSENNY